jgi:hypothetical protein
MMPTPLQMRAPTWLNQQNHYVSPYTTSRGTTVQGHYQTNSNNTQLDNYGTRGNGRGGNENGNHAASSPFSLPRIIRVPDAIFIVVRHD